MKNFSVREIIIDFVAENRSGSFKPMIFTKRLVVLLNVASGYCNWVVKVFLLLCGQDPLAIFFSP